MDPVRQRPRIGVCGMSIEASTFSPHRSGWEAFALRRGEDLLGSMPFLAPGQPLRQAADWIGLVHARSQPGGAVVPEVFQAVKAEIVERLTEVMARPDSALDGVFFDIHGAMNVVGRYDAEAELAEAVRAAVGPEVLISTSMDLHGNVSRRLAAAVDMMTCYRMAPHEDWLLTRCRAGYKLLSRLGTARHPGAGKPVKAWINVPVLLPGEKTSTRVEPARSIYAELSWIEVQPGVLDASVWIGYAWGDEPRNMAAVVVEGDDEAAVRHWAEHLARRLWEARGDFVFVAPTGTLGESVEAALAPGAARPFLISDSGDNPTAGGSGDVTWTLAQLLADPRLLGEDSPTTLVASIFDAAAVAACAAAGVGSPIVLEAGARVDQVHSGPVRLDGVVEHLTAGDETSGRVAVVRTGGLRAIITERRKPYHTLSDFQCAGLDPRAADLIVVKIGYLEPELYDLAADWRLALTPGGVDQDLIRLAPSQITRPMYPFDPDMPDPDLSATIV